MVDSLKQNLAQADAHMISEEIAKAQKPAIDGCLARVSLLETMMAIVLPDKNASSWARTSKVFLSVGKREEVK